MSGILNKFRPAEVDSTDGVHAASPHSPAGSARPSNNGGKDIDAEKDIGLSSARDIVGAEANRKLAIFERAHRWDPNLDDSQLDAIDDAVNARDPSSETRVFDEVFENSPYPEVLLNSSFVLAYAVHLLVSTCKC